MPRKMEEGCPGTTVENVLEEDQKSLRQCVMSFDHSPGTVKKIILAFLNDFWENAL